MDKKVLRKKLKEEAFNRITISFYHYFTIKDPQEFRDELYKAWQSLKVFGRVYIASEGINAQISVPEHFFEDFKDQLYSIVPLKGIRLNIAIDDDGKSFYKLIIKVRSKIVADGLEENAIDFDNRGKHIKVKEFNELTDDPETILIDMRNHYESEVGHFENAVCPDVDTFRDSLPIIAGMLEGQEDKNIVMYCTGGIRCEKAGAYFKNQGFKNVFQLEGGIIEYTRQAEKQGLPNKFKGKNFVFDERLGERISKDIISKCHQCGKPCDTHINCANDACHLLFIQCEECGEKYEACCSQDCKEVLHLPLEEQKALREGINKGRQVYKKGRLRPKLGDG